MVENKEGGAERVPAEETVERGAMERKGWAPEDAGNGTGCAEMLEIRPFMPLKLW